MMTAFVRTIILYFFIMAGMRLMGKRQIGELERAIADIEGQLATPEGASDASLYTRYSELKKDLSDAMDVWTERTMELEAMS